MAAILPRLGERARFAIRSTAITSATSDSTTSTTSDDRRASSRTVVSSRLRDSASAGNASSASNAAVRRRPWPSLCRRLAGALTRDFAALAQALVEAFVAVAEGAMCSPYRHMWTNG